VGERGRGVGGRGRWGGKKRKGDDDEWAPRRVVGMKEIDKRRWVQEK
jgi:hypothetical protein